MNNLSNIFNHFSALLLGACAIFLCACESDNKKHIPDVSDISLQVKIQRFDRDLIALDTSHLAAGIAQFSAKYPKAFEVFTRHIIHDLNNPDETPEQAIGAFLSVPQIRFLFDTVQRAYPDLSGLEADLSRMFRFYKYYLPEKPTPQVVSIVSEFATDAFTYGDSLCGIGLDMFLGENFQGYDPQRFPSYIRRQFKAEYIPVRLAKVISQEAVGLPKGQSLLDLMLLNGKALYLASSLLPHAPDSLIMGYTQKQIEGCYANEQNVWAKILADNLLYSNELKKFQKLIFPSPNAPAVFTEAPGEIGNWVGWQIVKSYMKRHPNTSMPELIALKDAQPFLEAARYKPAR